MTFTVSPVHFGVAICRGPSEVFSPLIFKMLCILFHLLGYPGVSFVSSKAIALVVKWQNLSNKFRQEITCGLSFYNYLPDIGVPSFLSTDRRCYTDWCCATVPLPTLVNVVRPEPFHSFFFTQLHILDLQHFASKVRQLLAPGPAKEHLM